MQVPSLAEWMQYKDTFKNFTEDNAPPQANTKFSASQAKAPVGDGKRTSSATYAQRAKNSKDNKRTDILPQATAESEMSVPEMPVTEKGADPTMPYVPSHESVCVRAAISNMQKNFLVWQAAEQEKTFQDGVDSLQRYEEWLANEIKKATRDMNPTQRMQYNALAAMQGKSFYAWSEGYGQACEKYYAHETQQNVLANNAQMLMANIHEPPLAVQAIEQTMAAARESARMQGLNATDSKALEERMLTAALQPALQAKIDNGELDLAEKLFQQHGMLMDKYTAQEIQQALFIAHERQAKEKAFAQRKEHMHTAERELLHMDEASAIAKLNDSAWCASMHLTDAIMVKHVREAVAMQRQALHEQEKAEKRKQTIVWYGELVRMAIGDSDAPKDPMAALRFVQANTELDAESRTAITESLLFGRMDKTDHVDSVLTLQNRIFTEGDAIDRMDILHHIVHGNIHCETGLQLFTMQEKLKEDEKALLRHGLIILDTYLVHASARLAARNMYLHHMAKAIENDDFQQMVHLSHKESVKKIAECFSG